MLSENRRELILKKLRKQKTVTRKELTELFDVSVMTLWRDINLLEKQGLLKKIHGGISEIIPGDKAIEKSFLKKDLVNKEKKEAIAKAIVKEFINPGDIITLEGGSTATTLLSFILKEMKDITILTNSMQVCSTVLKSAFEFNLICSGGVLRNISETFVGPNAQAFFDNHRANILFISAAGFTTSNGFTDPNPLEIQVKQHMIRNSDKIVAMLDSTKIGVSSLMKVIDIKDIDFFITDDGINEKDKDWLLSKGVNLRIVYTQTSLPAGTKKISSKIKII